jgi:SAM-dependent methyltransferase
VALLISNSCLHTAVGGEGIKGRRLNGAASPSALYEVADWRDQFEGARTGLFKQVAYSALWPLFQMEAKRWLTDATLRAHEPAAVFRERGFPVEARRRWALARLDVKRATVLVQGTGSGWDVLTWARFRPKRIIATDVFAFESWDEISRYCAARWNVPCEFRQATLENQSFLMDGSVDVCVSDAVFEHCKDLDGVLTESRRVLKPGGRLYAAYGPLWFCGGGDHYSGRGGLQNLYNHLVLPTAEYKTYVSDSRQDSEPFQDGYRYITLDLFSKLTTGQYLEAFHNAGFRTDALILDLSSRALQCRKQFSPLFKRVVNATAGQCSLDDLIVKANMVRLTRR